MMAVVGEQGLLSQKVGFNFIQTPKGTMLGKQAMVGLNDNILCYTVLRNGCAN